MAAVDRPIIMVGTGRCGSTFLHRVVARHEDVGWLSPYNEVLPQLPWLAALSGLYRSDRLSARIKHLPIFPKPFEAYKFWEHYLPGFSRRSRPLTADDVPAEGIEPVRKAVERVLRASGEPRFLAKVTGWARILYFDRIFPDARFVHLRREPRAVVSSWIQAGWLDVSSAIDSPEWQWGDVPEPYRRLWRELGGGPLLSAAVKIQLDLDDIRSNMAQLPERTSEMSYEDLITKPEPELQALLAFCELPWTPAYEAHVRELTFYDSRDRWRKHLSDAQGDLVLEFFQQAEAVSPARG